MSLEVNSSAALRSITTEELIASSWKECSSKARQWGWWHLTQVWVLLQNLESAASFHEVKSVMLVLEAHHFIQFLSPPAKKIYIRELTSVHVNHTAAVPVFYCDFLFCRLWLVIHIQTSGNKISVPASVCNAWTCHCSFSLRKKQNKKHLIDNFSNSCKQLLLIISCSVSQSHNCQNTCEKADGNR